MSAGPGGNARLAALDLLADVLDQGRNLGDTANIDGAVPIFDETPVNRFLSDTQFEPASAGLADGGYVVVWTSAGQDGHVNGIFAQRFEEPAAIGGFQAVVLQKLHEVPCGMVGLSAVLDQCRRLVADTANVLQQMGTLLDDLQQIGPKMVHQAFHQLRPDPANHTRCHFQQQGIDHECE